MQVKQLFSILKKLVSLWDMGQISMGLLIRVESLEAQNINCSDVLGPPGQMEKLFVLL